MSKLAVLATAVLLVVATALPAVANDRPDFGHSKLLGGVFSIGPLGDFLKSLDAGQSISSDGDASVDDGKGGVSGDGDSPGESSVSGAGGNLDDGTFRQRLEDLLKPDADSDLSDRSAEEHSSSNSDGGSDSDNGSDHDVVLPKVIQQLGNDNESGDVDLSFGVSQTGDNSNQAVTPLQFGNTGSNQNTQGFVQDNSTADDLEADGSTFVIAPSLNAPVDQAVKQSSGASSKK